MFDDLTDIYEAMIDWPKRLTHEGSFYRRWFEEHGVRSVVDAACGTGRHAAMFHSWGLRVEGADISPAMIDRARSSFGEPAGLRWVVRGFDEPIAPVEPFDAAVCMGNSLPLAPDMATARRAIGQMLAAVRDGGLLVVHALNLWHLPDGPCVWQKCRPATLPQGEVLIIKGVHRCGVRGYVELIVNSVSGGADIPVCQRDPRKLGRQKCLPHLDEKSGLSRDVPMQSESIPFLGLEADEIARMAQAAGAREVQCFGGYRGEPYDRQQSVDLLIVAKK